MRHRLRTLLIVLAMITGNAAGQQPPQARRGYDDIDRLDELLPKLAERARQQAKEERRAAERAKLDTQRRAMEMPFGIPGLRFPVNIERAMQIDCLPTHRSNI